jgi:hypothetical protein
MYIGYDVGRKVLGKLRMFCLNSARRETIMCKGLHLNALKRGKSRKQETWELAIRPGL